MLISYTHWMRCPPGSRAMSPLYRVTYDADGGLALDLMKRP